jgi:molybdopterin-biosynthesis enzyme MoeA-like protein
LSDLSGIGPTHDDRTFAGVAVAFEDSLTVNVELEKVVREYFAERMDNTQDTQPYLKLCTVRNDVDTSPIPF